MGQTPQYYQSIDGIRAIAVSIVVLFHAGVPYTSGGFIGVDVFFVISGFLIMNNILRDLANEDFSLSHFYIRRAARLLPALFTVVLVSLLVGFFTLGPNQLSHLAGSALAASFIVSNIFFWFESGYFAADAESLPLLHTWPLGVEEQFYLFWPLLILLVLSGIHKRNAIIVICLLWLASFAMSYLAYERNPSAVFYLLPFRVQEFTLGALIAFSGQLKSDSLRAIIAILSIWSVAYLTITVNGTYDGIFMEMVLPSLAAAGLVFGAASRELNWLLSSKVLVWLGKRSYSIYLVHWPIGVFLPLLFFEIERADYFPILVILLSLFLGFILHREIEQRFRLSKKSSSYNFSMLATASLVSIVYRAGNGIPQRLSADIRNAAMQFDEIVLATNQALQREDCEVTGVNRIASEFRVDVCVPITSEQSSYLVLGDSLAANAYLVFSNAYPETEFGLLTIPGCPIRAPSQFTDRMGEHCKAHYLFAFEELMNSARIDGVILASAWTEPFSDINEITALVNSKGLRPIVVGENMEFYRDIPDIMFGSVKLQSAMERVSVLQTRYSTRIGDLINTSLREGTEFVNLVDYQCQPNCDVLDENARILYLDSNHITHAGGELFGARLRDGLPELFN